jgi:hypothetical protein
MTMRVQIEIKDGQPDCKPLYSVRFFARTYGRGAPCCNKGGVKKAVESSKEWIRKEGDIPVVVDKRKEVQLTNWLVFDVMNHENKETH